MGAALASNISKQVTDETISFMNTASQCCYTDAAQLQWFVVQNWNGGNVTISGVDQEESSILNATCQQTVTSNSTINSQINQSAKNVASAITQALGIGFDVSINVAENVTALMVAVTNAVQNQCTTQAIQEQSFIVQNFAAGTTGSIYVNTIKQGEAWNFITACAQQDTNVTSASTTLTNSISQSAEAQVEGIFGNLGFLLIIILVIIGAILFLGVKALTNPVFLVVLVVIIGLWLGLAYWRRWWPFK